ncbi:MAG: recombinase family protein [Labilithrix sp.]|nr:recombinase family protein [Labilithrix sp.]MBX3219182.1 recombinase family protein [Labilithrix sp.]
MSGPERARRAIAYIRLSDTSPELAEGSTEALGAQRRTIEAWAGREGVEVRAWQLDVGVNGATPIAERPGLLAAYAAIREHRAGVLVAANADRFAHDELVRWLIERAALAEGAAIHTADGSPVRRAEPAAVEAPEQNVGFTRGAVDLARAYDRVLFRSRVRAALAEKKARGERVGTVPYGFRLAADGVHVEPDDAEQAVVSSVRRLASEGLSQRAIVAHLADRGVAGRTGAPLRQTQVAKILRSA